MAQSGKDFGVSFGINTAIFVAIVLIFNYVRRNKWLRRYYAPKRSMDIPNRQKPDRLPPSFFTWMFPLLAYNEDQILSIAGMDAAMYIRTIGFGLEVFWWLSLLVVPIIIPVNVAVGDQVDRLLEIQDEQGFVTTAQLTGLDQVSRSCFCPNVDAWPDLERADFFLNITAPAPSAEDRPELPFNLNASETAALQELFEDLSGLTAPPGTLELNLGADATEPEERIANRQEKDPAEILAEQRREKQEELRRQTSDSLSPVEQCELLSDVINVTETPWLEGIQQRGLLGDDAFCMPDVCCDAFNLQRAGVDEEKYVLSDLDKTSMANIDKGESILWVHAIWVWLVSIILWQKLARYNQEAVSLRIRFLSTQPRGTGTHTMLVTDVPGCEAYTKMDRAFHFRTYLPQFLRRKVEAAMEASKNLADASASLPGAFSTALPGASSLKPGQAEEILDSTENSPRAPKGDQAISVQALGERLKGQPLAQDDVAVDIAKPVAAADEKPPSAISRALYDIDLDSGRPQEVLSEAQNLRKTKREMLGSVDPWVMCSRRLEKGMSMEDMVFREFDRKFVPNSVAAVNVVRNTSDLEALLAQYEKTKVQLEDLIDHMVIRFRRKVDVSKRPQMSVFGPAYGKWGTDKYGFKSIKVDKLAFLVAHLEELKRQIDVAIPVALDTETPSAFVTVKNRRSLVMAVSSLVHYDETIWKTHLAPGPEELIWENLPLRGWERSARSALVWAGFVAMCLFFMIPVIFVQGLISRAEDWDWLNNIPFVSNAIVGFLPGLALKIFLIIVPIILRIMNYYQGMYSKSAIDLGVVRKYFLFQVLIVFIFQFIAGSLLNQLDQLRDDPGSIITILGTAVPQQATFYLTYILLQGLTVKPITFLRIPGAAIYLILSKLAGTERAKARIWQEQYIEYGDEIPDHSIVILLGLVFAVVQPLVLLCCLVYFVTNNIIARYQLLYVFRESYQSGGRLWPIVYDQIMTGVIIFQLMMLGFLGVKEFKYSVLLVFPVLISVYMWWTSWHLYRRPQQGLSLHTASELDKLDREDLDELGPEKEQELLERTKHAYRSLVFKMDLEEHMKLLGEADIVHRKLNGENISLEALDTVLEECGESPFEDCQSVLPSRTVSGVSAATGALGAQNERPAKPARAQESPI